MKIVSVEWGRVSIPLRTPFKTALRTVASVEDIIVKLTADTDNKSAESSNMRNGRN